MNIFTFLNIKYSRKFFLYPYSIVEFLIFIFNTFFRKKRRRKNKWYFLTKFFKFFTFFFL